LGSLNLLTVQKKKILITGSNGLLGQKIIYNLLKRGNAHIIATSKGENRLKEKKGYIYESLDITNKAEVEEIIKKHSPDCVINTAAMTNVDTCETQRKECWALNVTAVENIVEALENNPLPREKEITGFGTPRLIHLSTDFIFDGTSGPYNEKAVPNPLSYYALSKNESEKVVFCSQLKWAIARTMLVYGVVDNMSRSNIVLWAKDILSKGHKINAVDDQFRTPTLAEDLAEGCILIIEKEVEGIYNISGKDFMSILELVYKAADFWKLDKLLITPSKSSSLNQPAKRPPRTGFIIDKAIQTLEYNPHSFEEGLAVVDKQFKEQS